jgi:vacuolar-type H+-ATPase catalytic subunit A/Vma1
VSLVGTIERINGSLVIAKFEEEPKIGDLIEVGDLRLMGEISVSARRRRTSSATR